MKLFHLKLNNMGDNLNRPVMEWLGLRFEGITHDRLARGKFVGIGSLMTAVRRGDIVWGTGIMRPDGPYSKARGATFLAVRGKNTRKVLLEHGVKNVPEVYGDPALLLPLIYNPKWDFGIPRAKVAYMPHYIEKQDFWAQHGELKDGEMFIDIETQNWKSVVRKMKSADKIVTSSLHGIILADAYGIPVEWTSWTPAGEEPKLVGGTWKFLDYFSVTGRPSRKNFGKLPPLSRKKLEELQTGLIKAIQGLK